MRSLPIDLTASIGEPAWRDHLEWPLSLSQVQTIATHPLDAYGRLLAFHHNELRDTLLLSGPAILLFARSILEAAATIEALRSSGREFAYENDVYSVLLAPAGAPQTRPFASRHHVASVPQHVHARRLARTLHLARKQPARLARALLAPDILAISHNSLLISQAANSRAAISFDHAPRILADARSRGGKPGRGADIAAALASPVSEALMAIPEPTLAHRGRVYELIHAFATNALTQAAEDLAVLSSPGAIPGDMPIWSATGGNYSSRAIGLAARAAGRRVRRHDHVGAGSLIEDKRAGDFTEQAVSSEFVVNTAKLLRFTGLGQRTPGVAAAKIIGGHGDRGFRLSNHPPPQPSASKRVLYATSVLRGQRQYHSALPPELVYLDWQLRVVEALTTRGYEVIFQPHPESRFPPKHDPFEGLRQTSGYNFEKLTGNADVLLFDYALTTTFWKGLVSAHPVVFLDMGNVRFLPEVESALRERAMVLDITMDARNRPVLDTEALISAIETPAPRATENLFLECLG